MVIESCPQCTLNDVFLAGSVWICQDCGFEVAAESELAQTPQTAVTDCFGNVLADGDSVILIKELKVKGGNTLKLGTKVRNIKLKPEGDHNIDCKIDGVGMMLKSQFVKRA